MAWRAANPVPLGGAVKFGLLGPYLERALRFFGLSRLFQLTLLRVLVSIRNVLYLHLHRVVLFVGFDISKKGIRMVFFDNLLELPQMFLNILALLFGLQRVEWLQKFVLASLINRSVFGVLVGLLGSLELQRRGM